MITTNWSDDGGQLSWRRGPGRPLVGAGAHPVGDGIDPDLAWDDDGTCL